jgi:hypothetical protein
MSFDANESKERTPGGAPDKARAERVARLKKRIAEPLVDPMPALDALIAELGLGAAHDALWETLHANAAQSGGATLAEAYRKCASGPRIKRLPPDAQAAFLMRAADFVLGVIGDEATGETYLERVLDIAPGHAEAFGRLTRRLEKALDTRRLLEVYAKVVASPPTPPDVLATQVLYKLVLLSSSAPLSDDACKNLLALVPANAKVLDALDKHCVTTNRQTLACALYEAALLDPNAGGALVVQRRERLLELYMGPAASPDATIAHVEDLLVRDPAHAKALHVAQKLLSSPSVATRAAAALSAARRARGY